jgi:hypothetical protein
MDTKIAGWPISPSWSEEHYPDAARRAFGFVYVGRGTIRDRMTGEDEEVFLWEPPLKASDNSPVEQ